MNPLRREFFDAVEKMGDTPQRKDYHPEVWVWDHEAYVYYNILKNFDVGNQRIKEELLITAFFHDLGKIDTTFYRDDKECYVSYGHEKAALPYYDSVKEAVVPDHLREEVIRFYIEQHMKPKFINNMNESTIDELKEDAREVGDENTWDLLCEFSEYDDMNSFFKKTDEEERLEAKYRFKSYCEDIYRRIEAEYAEYDGEKGDLFLLRGVPGSGKTTIADILSDRGAYEVSADDFFIDEEGNYNFDGSKLSEAHDQSQRKTKYGMQAGRELIAVHNTFVQEWEMIYYFYLASKYNYKVHTLVVENRHESESTHNISESKIEEKREDFELKL